MLVLEEILELEVGVVGPPSLLSREPFTLAEVELDLLAEMRFSFLNIVEARYEFYSFLHRSRSPFSLIIFSSLQPTD